MARFIGVTFEPKLRSQIFFFGKRFILHMQIGKSHKSKYEDAEPTQHRYSTAATASASTGGRAKKTQKVKDAQHCSYDKAAQLTPQCPKVKTLS